MNKLDGKIVQIAVAPGGFFYCPLVIVLTDQGTVYGGVVNSEASKRGYVEFENMLEDK